MGGTDGQLNLFHRPDNIDPDLIVAFEDEFGVEVVEDFYGSNEALLAKLESGAVYDVVVPSDYMVSLMVDRQMLIELQRSAIPNLSNLVGIFADPAFDPGGAHSVAYQWGTTGLGVNLGLVGDRYAPSLSLVFDGEVASLHPGGVSFLDEPREAMGAALRYLGFSASSTSEGQLQQASDLIASVRGYVRQFESQGYADALIRGEVAVAQGRAGEFAKAFADLEDSAGFAFVIPEEGGTVWIDNLAVPVRAEHVCTAHTFIDFILDAENGAALSTWTWNASPNAVAEGLIPPEILENDLVYPPPEAMDLTNPLTSTGEFEHNYTDYFLFARR